MAQCVAGYHRGKIFNGQQSEVIEIDRGVCYWRAVWKCWKLSIAKFVRIAKLEITYW